MTGTWYETTLTVEAAFGSGPYDASPSWTDITEWVRPYSTSRGRTSEFTDYSPGTATIELDNSDRRFDPEHAAGPYFGDLVPMVPVRIRTTYNSVTYDKFYGFVLGWPQNIGKGYTFGTVTVELVDAFRILQQTPLVGCPFRNLVIDGGAIHYWPLQNLAPTPRTTYIDEIAGQNLTTQTVDPLVGGSPFPVVDPTLGAFDIGVPLGRTLAPRLTLYDLGASSYITDYLVGPEGDSTPGYGMEFWGKINASGTDQIAVSYSAGDTNYLRITISELGFDAQITDTVADIEFSGYLALGRKWAGVHHYAIWCDGTDLIGYVDGVEIGRQTLTTASFSPAAQPTLLRVERLLSTDDQESVLVSNIAVYPDGTEPDWAEHRIAGLTGYGHPFGEGTGVRIGRYLDEIGWPAGQRDMSPGDTVVGPYQRSVGCLTGARELATIERGLFFVAANGDITFRDRNWQYTQTSAGTFGDSPTDLQFSDIQPDANLVAAIRNQVTVGWAGGEIEAKDQTSIDAYGWSSDSIASDLIDSEATAESLAAYIVRIGKDPRTRITLLRVNPRRDPASLFPVVLGAELGSVLTITLTPLDVGSSTTYTVAVQGVRHRVNRRDWTTDLYLAPADLGPYFVVGDATLGRIGTSADNRIPY